MIRKYYENEISVSKCIDDVGRRREFQWCDSKDVGDCRRLWTACRKQNKDEYGYGEEEKT